MTDVSIEVEEIISRLKERIDRDLTLGKMFEVPRDFIEFPNLVGEISLYDNLNPVDVSMEGEYYVAQPTVWVAEISLWGIGEDNILKKRAPMNKSVIVIFRERGDAPVERMAEENTATEEWFISVEDSTTLVLKLNEMGLYPLKSKRIKIGSSDSENVVGQFNLVE